MQADKPFIELSGQTLLARAIERLRPQVDRLIINSNVEAGRLEAYGLPVIADRIAGFRGPLAGIHAAMQYAQTEQQPVTHIVSAAVDTPFFPIDLVERLLQAVQDSQEPSLAIAVPVSHEWLHPAFGLFPVALADDLERFLGAGQSRVRDWLRCHDLRRVTFDTPQGDSRPEPFFNINTPEDLETAKLWLQD
jgi:molybdopterin-guanine dinucleotide biosynthesis protein A